ncbi:MAG: segregation/condensation protein A [Candidatus Margulisbacteria bacterium]|nr:segregation/condensation protein A [Candidatus Margulisiibacteriota bacterium]
MTEDVAYEIEIEAYRGPFDLLLKAIDDGRVDIFRVSIAQIVASYFEYWKREEPDLVLASDFLIMAAYLLEFKSKALLPASDTVIEEEILVDVEDSLVSHLQEYEAYKNAAMTLRQRKEIFEKIYGRHEGEAQEKEFELVDVSLKDLVLAFKRVYAEAAKREQVVPIKAEEVTIDERIIEIKRMVAGRGDGVPFVDIFIRKTRLEIVVTFLAILELAKQSFIRIVQGRRFGSILIFARSIYEGERINNDGISGPAAEHN